MPLEYSIRPTTIWFSTRGDPAYQEAFAVLESAIAELRAEPDRARRAAVFDIRESDERRESHELRAIAAFVGANLDVLEPRCAVIAGDDFLFGMARMFEAFAQEHGVDVLVVRDEGAVESWLAGAGR